MAKDISKLFTEAVDKFRTERERRQSRDDRKMSVLELEFERVKDEARKLKQSIETHPKLNYFWIFTDKIVIDFHTSPRQTLSAQLVLRLYHPGNNRFRQGIFGYLPCGYEMPLATVDEAVEFIATQCGKLLA